MSNFLFAAEKAAFMNVVKQHLDALPDESWEYFRCIACMGRPSMPGLEVDASLTREKLLETATAESTVPFEDMIQAAKGAAVAIGTAEGTPVFCIEASGVYFWGKNNDPRGTLQLWLTEPVYPPGM